MIPKQAISSTVNDNGEYGSLVYSYEFEQAPTVLPPEALTGSSAPLPTSCTLQNLPAIAMQGTLDSLGSPGTCEAQSFGYCLGSYTAARNPDGSKKWDASKAEHEVSAAYLYTFEHQQEGRACPTASLAIPYLNRLIGYGAPSAKHIPYQPNCTYLNSVPIDRSYPDGTRFRLGSFAAFTITANPNAIVLIKQLVAAGYAVAFSGAVIEGYGSSNNFPALQGGILCSTTTIPNCGHGQVVVGYDDEIGLSGNQGALLIQNSFGTQWPPASAGSGAPAGMLWWSYGTFMATQKLAATAYPLETGALTGTTLTTSSGPAAAVNQAYQWAPTGSGQGVWLIAMLQFAEPIELTGVVFTEPNTGTTIAGVYGYNINNGYVYLDRTDGDQFVAGNWVIQLSGYDLSGAAVSYSGTIAIAAAQPASPPAAAVTQTTPVTDTTGNKATITVSSS